MKRTTTTCIIFTIIMVFIMVVPREVETAIDFPGIPATATHRATPGVVASASGYNGNFAQIYTVFANVEATMTPLPIFWESGNQDTAYFGSIIQTLDIPASESFLSRVFDPAGTEVNEWIGGSFLGTSTNPTPLASGGTTLQIIGTGFTGLSPAAEVRFSINDTQASGDSPGKITLLTSPDGGNTPTPAMWVDMSQDAYFTSNILLTANKSIHPHSAGTPNTATGVTVNDTHVFIGADMTPVGGGTPIPSMMDVDGGGGGQKQIVLNAAYNGDIDVLVYPKTTGTPTPLMFADASAQTIDFPNGVKILGVVYSTATPMDTATPIPPPGSSGAMVLNVSGAWGADSYINADFVNHRILIGDQTPAPAQPLHVVADAGHEVVRYEENSGGQFYEIQIDAAGDMNFVEDAGTPVAEFRQTGDVWFQSDNAAAAGMFFHEDTSSLHVGQEDGTEWTTGAGANSFSAGWTAQAGGDSAAAFGFNADAGNNYSVCMGTHSASSANYGMNFSARAMTVTAQGAYAFGYTGAGTTTVDGANEFVIYTDGAGPYVGIGIISPSTSFALDVFGDVNADSYTEYSKVYKGDALSAIQGISVEPQRAAAMVPAGVPAKERSNSKRRVKPEHRDNLPSGDWGYVDHSTLPVGVRVICDKKRWRDKRTGELMDDKFSPPSPLQEAEPGHTYSQEVIEWSQTDPDNYEEVDLQEDRRDIGAMVQVNTRAIMQLLERIESLEARVLELESQ